MNKYCGAQAWRAFIVEGAFTNREYNSGTVTCTLDKGHTGKHAGWMGFHTGAGKINAKVEW